MTNQEQMDLRDRLKRRLIWKVPLILALVGFAVWWQMNHNNVRPPSARPDSQSSSPLTGKWSAEVSYHSGERYQEKFFFQPEADRLYGTVSFRGVKRGIEDGKIAGAYIWFHATFEEALNGATRQRRHRYEGGFAGDIILLKLFDDAGSPPIEFSLTKNNGEIDRSAKRQ